MRIKHIAASAIAASGVVAFAVVVVDPGANSPTRHPAQAADHARDASSPEASIRFASSDEAFSFSSLRSMVATSDVVVRATVVGVASDHEIGSGEHSIGFNRVRLKVADAIHGTPRGATVDYVELSSAGGLPVAVEGLVPAQVGDTGVFFLQDKPNGKYVLVSTQGRYLEGTGHGFLQGLDEDPRHEDSLVRSLAELSPAQLRDRVQGEAKIVNEKNVEPLVSSR